MSKTWSIALVVVLLIAVLAGIWLLLRQQQKARDITTVQNLRTSIVDADKGTAAVPIITNPLKQAAPPINPIKQTNPFDHAYQNPFQ